jgi:hypothetical protein
MERWYRVGSGGKDDLLYYGALFMLAGMQFNSDVPRLPFNEVRRPNAWLAREPHALSSTGEASCRDSAAAADGW